MQQSASSNNTKKIILWLSIGVILSLSIWLYFRYWFVYSEGTRVGILYKFSRKGTVFKTYEGEMLLPGLSTKKNNDMRMNTNHFFFSVREKSLADSLSKIQGQEIEVHYINYNHSLPWRGDHYNDEDGQYIVDKLVKIKNPQPNGYGL